METITYIFNIIYCGRIQIPGRPRPIYSNHIVIPFFKVSISKLLHPRVIAVRHPSMDYKNYWVRYVNKIQTAIVDLHIIELFSKEEVSYFFLINYKGNYTEKKIYMTVTAKIKILLTRK